MVYVPVRCKDCDCILWSDRAKVLKLCPECEGCDESDYGDLEERLEKLLNGA